MGLVYSFRYVWLNDEHRLTQTAFSRVMRSPTVTTSRIPWKPAAQGGLYLKNADRPSPCRWRAMRSGDAAFHHRLECRSELPLRDKSSAAHDLRFAPPCDSPKSGDVPPRICSGNGRSGLEGSSQGQDGVNFRECHIFFASLFSSDALPSLKMAWSSDG